MAAILLPLCCFVGCLLLMGAMWLMTRDREGARLQREVRRLNSEAQARRTRIASPATSPPAEQGTEQPVLGIPAPVVRR